MGSLLFLKYKSNLFISLLLPPRFLLFEVILLLPPVFLFLFTSTSICGFLKRNTFNFLHSLLKPPKIGIISYQITIMFIGFTRFCFNSYLPVMMRRKNCPSFCGELPLLSKILRFLRNNLIFSCLIRVF